MTTEKESESDATREMAKYKVSIEEDAIYILKENEIENPTREEIEIAIRIMEEALEDAIEDGYFD